MRNVRNAARRAVALPAALCAIGLTSAVAVGAAGGAVAQTRPEITVELNKAEKADKACRMTFVTENALGVALDKLSLDVVVFDQAGVVGPRLVLDMGAMPEGKTKVVDFDVPDTECGKVSRLLFNAVQSCTSGGKPVGNCEASVEPDSKIAKLPFDK
ncbi:hypothetical protein [Acidimangrovimonas sediminis]|uniref:hypothetical protein n=1 Tax=Acidimangrovimonas sediminis TaxID=2056283 RepID=UPI000C80F141|nr:hypothetical protein [Acidimangrovimonas sediminis]